MALGPALRALLHAGLLLVTAIPADLLDDLNAAWEQVVCAAMEAGVELKVGG